MPRRSQYPRRQYAGAPFQYLFGNRPMLSTGWDWPEPGFPHIL